jgi:uncharacterized protein with ATP-grasp and redox domains
LKIDIECVECIINQSVRVANIITDDNNLKNKIISNTKLLSKDFSFKGECKPNCVNPPFIPKSLRVF